MDRKKVVMFTFSGALVWNTVLVTAGYLLGEEWMQFWERTDGMDWLVLGLLGVVLVLYFIYQKRKRVTRSSDSE
jgi:membrane protein DedA with SNARE-associated domain